MSDGNGEPLTPAVTGLMEAKHVARYALAAQLAPGRRVLDAACGAGRGTWWLMRAGAASASGVDISAEAVAHAKDRAPQAEFIKGDLASLPWDDGAFDLVVCFEALEHVVAQRESLEELARVLAPDGVLMLSSPDPRVYPPGQPFHGHQLTPKELLEEVGQRLPHKELWYQHTQFASVLAKDEVLIPGEAWNVDACVVTRLGPGTDMYSLVVASRGALPTLRPFVACAPSNLHFMLEEREVLLQRIEGLEHERQALLHEREILIPEREALRRQRERTALLLLEAEQRLAHQPSAELDVNVDRVVEEQLHQTAKELRETIDGLNGIIADRSTEIAALRSSRSWRITAPIRTLSAIARRLRP